jgi:predicted DNA-binding transcriptional regulator AlpA
MTQDQDKDSPPPVVDEMRLLNVDHLAMILGRAVSSIRSDASRCPHSLPPMVRIPGARRLLWRKQDVEAWLAGLVAQPVSPPSTTAPGRRRGRPRKIAAREYSERQ